jgi:hypothetical protein
VDPSVQDLPGHLELSTTVTDVVADLSVHHAAVVPKNSLANQMEEVETVEELSNPIAEVQQWVLKDALRKHFSYAYSKDFFFIIIVSNYNTYILYTIAIHGESRAPMSCAFIRSSFALNAL